MKKMRYECQWDPALVDNYNNVNTIKAEIRKGNWTYMSRHPEIRAIIRVLIHEMINRQPENLYEFAASLFNCNNTPLVVPMINRQLKVINRQLKRGRWADHDAQDVFDEVPSTHSLLSKPSIGTNMDAMLNYAMILRGDKRPKEPVCHS